VDRRARYLDAALALFLEHGYHGVSMDQLVAACGGSKATLYRYFPSKTALFEAIIDDVANRTAPPEHADDLAAMSVGDGLRLLGRATAAAALDLRTIVMLRLAVGEQARFPELGQSLYEHGPARTYARLRAFLTAKQASGEVRIDDLQVAAEQFLGGIIGHQQLRLTLGLDHPGSAAMEARVEAAVTTFLAAYGNGAPRRRSRRA
jgi:AcrR family transcriptional regulator